MSKNNIDLKKALQDKFKNVRSDSDSDTDSDSDLEAENLADVKPSRKPAKNMAKISEKTASKEMSVQRKSSSQEAILQNIQKQFKISTPSKPKSAAAEDDIQWDVEGESNLSPVVEEDINLNKAGLKRELENIKGATPMQKRREALLKTFAAPETVQTKPILT